MGNGKNLPEYGDVVCVDRTFLGVPFEHYGIYIGNERVIEYNMPRKKQAMDKKLQQLLHFVPQEDSFWEIISSLWQKDPERAGVIESPFEEFLAGSKNYKICYFPDEYGRPEKRLTAALPVLGLTGNVSFDGFLGLKNIYRFFTDTKEKYHLYTPEETVERAKRRLGEQDYNLLTNNCEYFAIWCKTGVHESHQIKDFLNDIKDARLTVAYEPG